MSMSLLIYLETLQSHRCIGFDSYTYTLYVWTEIGVSGLYTPTVAMFFRFEGWLQQRREQKMPKKQPGASTQP